MNLFILSHLMPTRGFVQVPSSSQITAVFCLSNPLSVERSLLIIQVLGSQRLSGSSALNASRAGVYSFNLGRD